MIALAIIGILLSLLIPALSNARKKSRDAVCQSRLKQLYDVSMMYSLENDNYFVYNAIYPADRANQRIYWFYVFTQSDRPYYLNDKQQEIMSCPVINSIYNVTSNNYRTTGMNSKLITGTAKITKISNPAHKIIYGDGYSHTNASGKSYSNAINYTSRAGGEEDYIHDGKKNVVHVDGHVESNTKSYLVSDQDLWDYN